MKDQKLEGVFPVLTLPFTEEREVDFPLRSLESAIKYKMLVTNEIAKNASPKSVTETCSHSQ